MRVADKPLIKPERPWFSAGPTAKRPGYAPGGLPTNLLGRGIRAPEVVERFAHGLRLTREVLEVPDDFVMLYTPGSDTGAVEAALWGMLGARGVQRLGQKDGDGDGDDYEMSEEDEYDGVSYYRKKTPRLEWNTYGVD